MDEISTLQKRAIQTPVITALLCGFIAEIGYEKAVQIATAAIQADAASAGQALAEKFGGNGIPVLARVLKEVWAEAGALEFTLLEESAEKLSFDVTRCRYAELYERLGVKEFGACLSCSRDEALIPSFNARMQLTRTHTIMQGAPTCDFRIVVK